ncbi:MAG: hypothetical protein PHR16_02570 [Methylovulum sp.]|nr:hypothetical protein [Methylovulum sp.]
MTATRKKRWRPGAIKLPQAMTHKTPAKAQANNHKIWTGATKPTYRKNRWRQLRPFRRHRLTTRTTEAQPTRDKTAQRYGKGRAASESETKPPNLDKKPNFKTANGRRVPLTDLLGAFFAIQI